MDDDQFARWTEIHESVAAMCSNRDGAPRARPAESVTKSKKAHRVFRFFEPNRLALRTVGRDRRQLALFASFKTNRFGVEYVFEIGKFPFQALQRAQIELEMPDLRFLEAENEQENPSPSIDRISVYEENFDLMNHDVTDVARIGVDMLIRMERLVARAVFGGP